MKTFNKYNAMDEMEERFLELAHLDELEIKFDLIELPNDLFYFYKEEWRFIQDKKSNYFYVNDDIIFDIETEYELNNKELSIVITDMLEKYLGIKNYIIY